MPCVKVNWSGGKDSTASVLLHLKRSDEVVVVCYIPMFDRTIPLIQKDHYDFICRTADRFRSLGATVHLVSGMTYVEYCTHVSLKGKFKGQIFGFPTVGRGQCGFKRDSKLKALASVDVACDYEDIGIAFDEKDRHGQLDERKCSILVEEGYTELDAQRICYKNGLLSPIYTDVVKRDGCVLCPNSKDEERERWFNDYPEARYRLKELQDYVLSLRPDRMPLRGYRAFF